MAQMQPMQPMQQAQSGFLPYAATPRRTSIASHTAVVPPSSGAASSSINPGLSASQQQQQPEWCKVVEQAFYNESKVYKYKGESLPMLNCEPDDDKLYEVDMWEVQRKPTGTLMCQITDPDTRTTGFIKRSKVEATEPPEEEEGSTPSSDALPGDSQKNSAGTPLSET